MRIRLNDDFILVKECRDALGQVCSYNSVRIAWVPNHNDYKGNEAAERLAKLESDDMSLHISPDAKLPISFTKRKIDELLHKEWHSKWACAISKLF